MEELRNLNKLNRGINKQWIWGNKNNFYRSCDYLKKINYSIQDLNAEIKNFSNPTIKEVVFVIVLVDWICEAVKSIQEILRSDVVEGFIYQDDEMIKKSEKYFKAIRSFIVAHPLNTNRHKAFGLDGDFVCVDVRKRTSTIVATYSDEKDWFYFNLDGLQENAKEKDSDFVLYVYSQRSDGMQYFKYIRADFSDLFFVAKLQIERLYALDKYLSKLSKANVGE